MASIGGGSSGTVHSSEASKNFRIGMPASVELSVGLRPLILSKSFVNWSLNRMPLSKERNSL